VKAVKTPKWEDEYLGDRLMKDFISAAVIYRRKRYSLITLVEKLAQRVEELEKKDNQCVPTVECLFKGRELLDSLGKDEIKKILKEKRDNG